MELQDLTFNKEVTCMFASSRQQDLLILRLPVQMYRELMEH